MSEAVPLHLGGLSARQWKRFLSAPDPELVRELYEPALSVAVRYDRCCAYFSSSVLAAAARGFGPFIERLLALGDQAPRPAIRLLVNEELQEPDVRALLERGDTSGLEALLQSRLGAVSTALEKRRLEMLTFLFVRGLLDIRVGVMRQSLGILHAKFGIITDAAGDAVIFNGSGNESASGLRGNYEQIEVSGSWEDSEREQYYRDQFEKLWSNEHPDVRTVDLPEAVHERLVKMAPPEPPPSDEPLYRETLEAAMRWQYIAEAPYLVGPAGAAACDATAFVTPWPHQQAVVEEAVAAWPEGRLLCDEVGMGKTIEAILILRRLLHGRGVRRVLLLLPAGLMQQWQEELREKGGLVVPRYEGGHLVLPDGGTRDVESLPEALRENIVIVSRELARLHQEEVLEAPPWDLVLADESHAARRARQEETEFNSATLLLGLLRRLQLQGRCRSFLLLSATPMQTHPWEPFDLLQVLGEGGEWLADFTGIRTYYAAAASLARGGECQDDVAARVGRLIALDGRYLPPPTDPALDTTDRAVLTEALGWSLAPQRPPLGRWLRREAPLARRMHRNTRQALRLYYERGLIDRPPPERIVEDERFDYQAAAEQEVYDAVGSYIERRFEELEREKPGKGFVMTIYRRRTSSSPLAIQRSLERRKEGLERVIDEAPTEAELGEEEVHAVDLEDAGEEFTDEAGAPVKVSRGLPEDPAVARRELADVEDLLAKLRSLAGTDSKRDCFFEVHQRITADGRPILVFTEAADTMDYIRDQMLPLYGTRLATYSGRGGQRWTGSEWEHVTKQTVAEMLERGELGALVCTDAASEGLNLQSAGALVNYDLPWNPSRVEQRIGRIDRIGQRYPEVRIVNMFLRDSVDDRVYQVLQERCGLFRHFVGQMQPVLAEARKVLLGRGGSPDSLRQKAEEIGDDDLSSAVYEEAASFPEPGQAPALTAHQLFDAVASTHVGGFYIERETTGTLHVTGTAGSVHLSISDAELGEDATREPLTLASPVVAALTTTLKPEAPLLPLVVETKQQGAFRASAARWVHEDGTCEPVENYDALQALLAGWDGSTPDRGTREAARQEAAAAADVAVAEAVDQAQVRESRGRDAQIEAARGRLMRELCRYLLVRYSPEVTPDGGWLNQSLYRELGAKGAASVRFRQAHALLGGYPDWDPLVVQGISDATSSLNEARRNAVLSLTMVDAALGDPRWEAQFEFEEE
jgi:superfamily II DNA or RNA helicase